MFLVCSLDCKTVRIFAYSSTREQSNKRSGTTLKTESQRLLRHSLPISLLILRKKTGCFTVYMFFKVFLSLYTYTCVSIILKEVALPQERQESKSWILDSALWIPDSRYLVPEKHPVLRIPQAKIYRISDPTNKNFPYSGSHYQNFPMFQIPQTKLLYSRSEKQKFPVLWTLDYLACCDKGSVH